jgi:cytochrome c biogenesis protein
MAAGKEMSAAEELVPAGPAGNAVSEVAQLPAQTEEESHLVIEQVWRFFCSLRLTLVNLLLLFLGMIAGTYDNPANDSLANIEKAFAGRPWVLGAYRWFELYDLFHSWWFTALLLSLALNLIACSLERLPRIYYLVRYPERRLDRVIGLRFRVPSTASALTPDDVAQKLQAAGYKVQSSEGFVFAERGRYARFGVWVVHLSLLLILGGGVFGRLTAFEGISQVPQNGGITTSFIQRNPDGSEFKHRLVDPDGKPFLVQCTDFRLKEFEPGRPKAFESDLAVFSDQGGGEPGPELARATITVNHPLRYGGLTFYQASYSQLEEGMRAKLRITDGATGKSRDLMASAGEKIDAAEGLSYQPTDYNADFAGLGPALQIERTEDGRRSSFWVFAKDPGFDKRNRDDRFSFAFERLAPLYATGLQIARDPSTPVVYTGCILLFAGIGIAFYTSHKRIWAQAAGGKVALGGASHRNAEAFSREFDDLCDALGVARPQARAAA